MYSYAPAETGTSAAMWACLQARAAVEDAVSALSAAAAGLLGLTEDTQWQSDGVRMLNAKLLDFQSATTGEIDALGARTAELDRAMFS